MKEKLQKYALIAEIVSAAAIVVSLVFVGLQIRGSTVVNEAATIQESVGYDIQMLTHVSGDADLARIVSTYNFTENDNLSDVDIVRAQYQMTALLRSLENIYFQYQLGLLSDDSWESRVTFLEQVIASPGYEKFQSAPQSTNFSGSFALFIKELEMRQENAE